MSTRKIVFFDIDHTLSDAWRRDAMIAMHKSHADVPEYVWDRYHGGASYDAINREAVALANSLRIVGFDIVLLTARPERFRYDTLFWLQSHLIDFDELIMRPDFSRLPSPVLKLEQATAYIANSKQSIDIMLIVDDRDDVIVKFAQHGVAGLKFVSPKGVKRVKSEAKFSIDEEAQIGA